MHGVSAERRIRSPSVTACASLYFLQHRVQAVIHILDWRLQVPFGLVATCFRDIFVPDFRN